MATYQTFTEAELYKKQLDDAIAVNKSNFKPIFAMMRHAAVYTNNEDKEKALNAIRTKSWDNLKIYSKSWRCSK